jgi:hypothetical protein
MIVTHDLDVPRRRFLLQEDLEIREKLAEREYTCEKEAKYNAKSVSNLFRMNLDYDQTFVSDAAAYETADDGRFDGDCPLICHRGPVRRDLPEPSAQLDTL